MHIRTPLAGLLLACLLTSCASSPAVRTQTVTIHDPVIVPVPRALTAPVPRPKLKGDDNGSLAQYILALQSALDAANARLEKIAGLQK